MKSCGTPTPRSDTRTDTTPFRSGRVDLASGFYYTRFDNLTVTRVPGYVPYYSELLDDLEMNNLADSKPQLLEEMMDRLREAFKKNPELIGRRLE